MPQPAELHGRQSLWKAQPHTWGSRAFPKAPRTLKGAQPSPTQHHPCRYWEWRAAFPGHPSPPLHSTQPWISTRNSLCYVSRWNWAQPSLEVTGMDLWEIRVPHHTAWDNLLSLRKGHEAQYPLQREAFHPLLNTITPYLCVLTLTVHNITSLTKPASFPCSHFTRSQDSTTGALWKGVMVAHRPSLHLRCHWIWVTSHVYFSFLLCWVHSWKSTPPWSCCESGDNTSVRWHHLMR